jgi:hypothetical protein
MQKNTQARFDLAFEAIKELEKKAQWYINKNPQKIHDVDFIKNTKNIEALSDFYNHMIEVLEDKDKIIENHENYIRHLQTQFEHLLKCMIMEDNHFALSAINNYKSLSPEQLEGLLELAQKITKETFKQPTLNIKSFLFSAITSINQGFKPETNTNQV